MTPSFCSKVPQRLFPVRWWLLAASIVAMSFVVVAIAYAGQKGFVVAALAGALVGLPWAGLCAAVWFHPERGNMQPASSLAVFHGLCRWAFVGTRRSFSPSLQWSAGLSGRY